MSEKLSEYEKFKRRHRKTLKDIVKYLDKIIKKTLPYHTTDISIDALGTAVSKIKQLQAENEDLNKRRNDLIDEV